MVYLVIKELSSEAEDVIMVTSSIMKDTSATGQGEVYRSNAIRALCRIIDVGVHEASPSWEGGWTGPWQATAQLTLRPD